MGDATSGPIRLSFNPQLRVEFRGATVTSDAGLLLPRELDERLGLRALIERHLSDPRTGYNRQFALPDLLRQSIYSRLAGYEDTNDAERLAEDPTFRMLASHERRETSVALTSTLHWFETEVLAEERNYQGLARLNTALIQPAVTRSAPQRVTLDIDSSESPVHGAQEQSAYNGHFESVCYHPLFVFNQDGDCLAAKLRPGQRPQRWDEVLIPVIDWGRAQGQTVVVRADAAFALPALYESLERRGVTYATRLPANAVLERDIEDLLVRPRGRPSHAPLVRYRSFQYQAASWDQPRRVIAKVEHHLGELFPRVGFIVTTLTGTNRAVVRFYNLDLFLPLFGSWVPEAGWGACEARSNVGGVENGPYRKSRLKTLPNRWNPGYIDGLRATSSGCGKNMRRGYFEELETYNQVSPVLALIGLAVSGQLRHRIRDELLDLIENAIEPGLSRYSAALEQIERR